MQKVLVVLFLVVALQPAAHAQYSVPVTVFNGPAKPVTVQDQREPVFIEASLTAPINSGGGILGNYTVPVGKRLVIEHLSFETNFVVCTFTSSIRVRINSAVTGAANFYANPMPPMALPGSSTRFTRASQDMKLYATANSTVQFNWTRTANGCSATGSLAVSGYLESEV